MGKGVIFTGAGAQRIARVIRAVEPLLAGSTRPARRPPLARGFQCVRVTSLEAIDGFYPCVWQEFDGFVAEMIDGEDAEEGYVFGFNGEQLTEKRYGALLVGEHPDDGLAVFGTWCCDDAPAVFGSGGATAARCLKCSGTTPTSWSLPLAGFLDGDGCPCSGLTGTIELRQLRSDPCSWVYGAQGLTLTKLTTGYQLDVVAGTCELRYTGGSEDCCVAQTLTFAGYVSGTRCGGQPATLTLTPSCASACATPCPHCTSGLAPAQWSIPLSGFGGGYAALNGTTATCSTRAGPCEWDSGDLATGAGDRASVTVTATHAFLAVRLGGTTFTYTGPAAPLACCTAAVFTFGGSNPNVPHTLTGTPSGGCCPAGGSVVTTCCPAGLSTTLHCTVTTSGGCACGNGATVTLTWDGSSSWTGSGAFGSCGSTVALTLTCDPVGCPAGGTTHLKLRIVLTGGGGCAQDETHCEEVGGTCSPLAVDFKVTAVQAACCSGSAGVAHFVITE